MTSSTATLIGFAAILMWSLLSLLTVASGAIPPFQLAAMTFAIAGTLGATSWVFRPGAARALKQPWQVWALGIGGLFGYHALFFFALRLAPPAEAQLVNYFWPLFIVLGSALLPDERLRAHHIIGALVALAGTVVLFLGRGGITFASAFLPGFACAFGAAVAWAVYSVLSRRFAAVPTDTVAGFCLATAVLAAIFHAVFETTHWPQTTGQWLAVAALGIGPVGAAFYVWDVGMKRGDIRILGVASYLAPLLSTGYLVLAGYATASVSLALAAALIATGGLIAAKDMIAPKRDDAVPIAPVLDAIAAWAASRSDIVGLLLVGSWARGAATSGSDIDVMVLVAETQAFRRDEGWLDEISWPASARVTGHSDADFGSAWSRHVALSNGHDIELTFAGRSWATTSPPDPGTARVVQGGCRVLIDKELLLARLITAVDARR